MLSKGLVTLWKEAPHCVIVYPHPVKFVGHKHFRRECTMILVCHVISNDRMIIESYDFQFNLSSRSVHHHSKSP